MIIEVENSQQIDTALPFPDRLGPYKVHPAINLLPLMSDEELKDLAEDIGRQGLIMPITLTYDRETIVDGRCRYLACMMNLEWPVFVSLEYGASEGEIVSYIVSKNVLRQHLDVDERASLVNSMRRIA